MDGKKERKREREKKRKREREKERGREVMDGPSYFESRLVDSGNK